MSTTTLSPALPAAGGFTPGLLPPLLPSPQVPERAHAGTRTRRKHAALAVLSAMAALLLFTALAFHGYVAWVIAHPYVPALYSNPKIAQGLDYSDVSFPSKSGRTTVHGWYIPAVVGAESHSDRTVVFSHGYGANREETWVPMYELAALLNRLHYNVFMFDYGYASSGQRSPATGGKEESQQLLAAVNYARSQGADEVVVWGFSMGAGTALQAALQTEQADSIDAMILDSTFLPSSDSLYNNVRQYMDLPKYPSIPIIEWMLPFFTGVKFNQLPVEQVLQTTYTMPLFIMHGTADAIAPVATAEQVSASQYNSLSREWIVEGGMHEMLYRTHPKEYIQRAALFLSQVDAARKSTAAA